MRYSLGAALHSLSLALVLAATVLMSDAWNPPSFKSRSNPFTIQLYSDTDTAHSKLSIRSPANNASFGAGITGVTLSKIQQYVSPSSSWRLTLTCVTIDLIMLLLKLAT